MNSQPLLLKWTDYEDNVSSTLEKQNSSSFCSDLILVSDELVTFQVHKFVLSAFSPMIKELLLKNPHPRPLIYLKGIKKEELQSLLNLVYFGKTSFNNPDPGSKDMFVKVIEKFQLTGFEESSNQMEKRIAKDISKPKKINDAMIKVDNNTKKITEGTEKNVGFDGEHSNILKEHIEMVQKRFPCRFCVYEATQDGHRI